MNTNNSVVAINEAEIDKCMLDVIECSNKIKSLFNKIDNLMETAKAHYVCSSSNILYSQYKQLSANYSTIIDNILSYNSDLLSLKRKYQTSFDDLTQNIKMETMRLEANGSTAYKEER